MTDKWNMYGPVYRPQIGGGLPRGVEQAVREWLVAPADDVLAWDNWREAWTTLLTFDLDRFLNFQPYIRTPHGEIAVLAPEDEALAHQYDILTLHELLSRVRAATPPATPAPVRLRPRPVLPFTSAVVHRKEIPMTEKEYVTYLASPEWKAKTRAAKKAADWKCELCGSRDRPLEGHHPTYDRIGHETSCPTCGKSPDIVVLCERCHRRQSGTFDECMERFALPWREAA